MNVAYLRAIPGFGSVSVISSFLLLDIPRHDTRLFEVQEALKRTLLPGFRAYIGAYISQAKIASGGHPGDGGQGGLRGPLSGACPPAQRNTHCVACCGPRNTRRTPI